MNKKRWVHYKPDRNKINVISQQFNISPLVATVVLNRGIEQLKEVEIFLEKDMQEIHDPFLMKDMEKAVKRMQHAIYNNEKITVYGDYDVDGVTSTAILVKYLDHCGAQVDYYIPDRLDEGYGVNTQALKSLYDKGTRLLVTVDSGITAVEEIIFANQLGIDVIITDHHECKEQIPPAYAIINPKQHDCQYPFKELAGVGVTFKLIQALAGQREMFKVIEDYCDIVCLGTVADVVPLLGENRLIVNYGLKLIQRTANLGLKALINVSGLNNAKISAGTIGFTIAPRVNAAGRVGSALKAVELFLTNDSSKAYDIAQELNNENRNRQETEARIFDEAMQKIDEEFDFTKQRVIVLCGENWHHGVIGIVASRLTDKFYRPSILITLEQDEGKGSGRSISGFNLFKALSKCEQYLVKFGGHELAAGLTIRREDIENFSTDVNKFAEEQLCEEDLIPRIHIDCPIQASHLTFDTIKQLEILEPFGMGNAGPIFAFYDATISDIRAVGEGKHLKITLEKDGVTVDAIGFNMGHYEQDFIAGDIVDVACALGINSYQGHEKIQLILKDIRVPQTKVLEYNYYKTFDAHIRSDIIKDVKANVKRCDEIPVNIIQGEDPNLIIVNSLSGALDVTQYLERVFGFEDNSMSCKNRYKLHYNVLSHRGHLDVLINPIWEKLNINNYYNAVYIYDPCFSLEAYNVILEKYPQASLMFDHTRLAWCQEVLDSIIPQRQDFVIVYQYIKTRSVNSRYVDNIFILTRRIAISYNTSINCLKLEYCLQIFQELGLLEFSICDEQIEITLYSNKGKKVNIEGSSILAHLRSLKGKLEDTITFLNKY